MAVDKTLLASMLIRLGMDTASIGKDVQKIKGNFDLLKSSVKLLGTTLAGVFSAGALINFGKVSFQAYQEQLKQEKLLLTALQGRKDIQERLIRQANYLQKTTLFEDDQIIGQQKMLAAMGLSEKQIRGIINASTQLATALGTDLDQAVKMLTGSFSGNLRELGKYVPELKNLTKEQLAAGEAVNWVNENMKGLAETAANTDPIKQMSKAWGEMKESFGEMIAPGVTKFADRGQKQFTIWGSDQLTFWQKASTFFNKKRTEELYDYVTGLEKAQVEQDDSIASTEKLTTAIKKEAKALKELSEAQIKSNLAAMAASVETKGINHEILTGKMSLGFSPSPITGKHIANPLPKSDVGGSAFDAQIKQNQDKFIEFKNFIENNMRQMTQTLNNMFADIAAGFGEALGTMLVTGKNASWGMILSPIADAMSSLGRLAIATGIATIGIKESLKSMNGYVAIAAGVALVAVAAAVKAGISNISNSMGSGSVSMPSVAASNGGDYLSRGFGEGYLNIKVDLALYNDRLAIAAQRGQQKMSRY